jgi:multicomponent Na+:H+ antiporter subunit F
VSFFVENITFTVIMPVLVIAVVLAFVRLVLGPSLPDRVVALDLMTTLGMGVIATYAIVNDDPIFLDVAIVLALVSFLGTIAFAYYVERRV